MEENRSDVLQIGIVGCGPIAQFAHLPAIAKAVGTAIRNSTQLCRHRS